MVPLRVCDRPDCGTPLTGQQRRWCSRKCREWGHHHDRRARERDRANITPLAAVIDATDNYEADDAWVRTNVHRGPLYERFIDPRNRETILGPLIRDEMLHREAAELLGTTQPTITRFVSAYRVDLELAREQRCWDPDPGDIWMLLPADAETRWAEAEGDETAEDQLLGDYARRLIGLRDRFFTDRQGRPLIHKPYHVRWIKAAIRCYLAGTRQMILSPPRHGKSLLLIHFVLWLILSRCNISIGWVSGIQDVAKNWVSAIKKEFDENAALRDAYLPPGKDWRPATRSSDSWSNEKLTVATRTLSGTSTKTPTLSAIGAGGTLHSLDFDIVVVDDFEDYKRNITITQQVENRRWFGQVAEGRKEEGNAFFVIGSRQDEGDIHGILLESPEWDSIIESCHDPNCRIDPFDEDAHIGCMLFPERLPYRWFMSKRRVAQDFGGTRLFDLTHQNIIVGGRGKPYKREQMEACRNYSRRLGELPSGLFVVAGIDPAPVNTQASWLWGYDPMLKRLYMGTADSLEGGGVQGVRQIVRDYFERFGCRRFVVEDVAWQKMIHRDELLRKYLDKHNIIMEGHETQGGNKWDPAYGVAAFGEHYETIVHTYDPTSGDQLEEFRKIDLPYGDPAAQMVVDAFIRQADRFSEAQLRNRSRLGKSDMLMAHWFPWKVIRQWMAETDGEDTPDTVDFEVWFPGFDAVGDLDVMFNDRMEVPWS